MFCYRTTLLLKYPSIVMRFLVVPPPPYNIAFRYDFTYRQGFATGIVVAVGTLGI